MTLWTTQDVSFEIVDDLTDDPVVTVRVLTPVGPVTFMAEPVIAGTMMVLIGFTPRTRPRMPWVTRT